MFAPGLERVLNRRVSRLAVQQTPFVVMVGTQDIGVVAVEESGAAG